MSEKPEKFTIEFEIPDYFKGEFKKLGRSFPAMATNLVLAVEVLKLRYSYQKKSYTEQEIYETVFKSFSMWMGILEHSFYKRANIS